MNKNLYLNLAVGDLAKTKEFFSALGFEFNQKFTNDQAAAMVINDRTSVMLLGHDHFKQFTKKSIADSTKQTEAIMAISVENREAVDALADKALKIGGTPANPPQDHGFMYSRSFQDLDGHIWEVFYMDESKFPGA
jgi:predicted lactoylglutathione lyase